jgi:hypothetical protein
MAERDSKGSSERDTSGQSLDAATQRAIDRLAAILEHVQQRVAATPTSGGGGPTQIEKDAAFGAAAFSLIDNGLSLQPAIDLISLTPPSGSVAGNTLVSIVGANFLPGATAAFGGRPAPQVVVVSSSELHVLTPPGSTKGAVDVVVTTFGGDAIKSGGFTYTG